MVLLKAFSLRKQSLLLCILAVSIFPLTCKQANGQEDGNVAVKKLLYGCADFDRKACDTLRSAVGKLGVETLLYDCANSDRKACGTLGEAIELQHLRGRLRFIDEGLLARIAFEAKDRGVRVKAISAMDGSNPALKQLAGSRKSSDEFESSAACIRLAIDEPRIRNRLPGITLYAVYSELSQLYVANAPTDVNGNRATQTLSGESVLFQLYQAEGEDRHGQTFAEANWSSHFPMSLTNATPFVPAEVRGEEMLATLLGNAVFTQDDLAELSSSEVPELSEAAVGKLTDQPALAKIAAEVKDPYVREAAVTKLTDQSILARIALEDKESYVRMSAARRLTDQSLLAKIAVQDKDADVRETAVEKLTDQSLLEKIALEDGNSKVQAAAVQKLTSRSMLERISEACNQGRNYDFCSAAGRRLADIRSNAK